MRILTGGIELCRPILVAVERLGFKLVPLRRGPFFTVLLRPEPVY